MAGHADTDGQHTSVTLAGASFDHVAGDDGGDVLYLRRGARQEPQQTVACDQGHAVSYDPRGAVTGLTIVNARWLLERDNQITATIDGRELADGDELTAAVRTAAGVRAAPDKPQPR